MVSRRFRCTLACEVPTQRTFSGPPKSREQYYELPYETAKTLIERTKNSSLPLTFEHDRSNHIGKVTNAELDEKNNLSCEIEVEDHLAHILMDGFHASKTHFIVARGVSLTHDAATGEPIEVAVCFGESGARPGSSITDEIVDKKSTNIPSHKDDGFSGTLIEASELSIPPNMNPMTHTTPNSYSIINPATTGNGSANFLTPQQEKTLATSSFLHNGRSAAAATTASPPSSSSSSSSSSSPPLPPSDQSDASEPPAQQQQQQQQQQPADLGAADTAELLEPFKVIFSSNLKESDKMAIVNVIQEVAARADQLKVEKEARAKAEQAARTAEQKNLSLEKNLERNGQTLKTTISKLVQRFASEQLTPDDENDLNQAASNGAFNGIVSLPAFQKLIEASNLALTFSDHVHHQQQQQQQQQQEDDYTPAGVAMHPMYAKSYRAYQGVMQTICNKQQSNRANNNRVSYPTTTSFGQEQQQQPGLVEGSNLASHGKRSAPAASTTESLHDSNGWKSRDTTVYNILSGLNDDMESKLHWDKLMAKSSNQSGVKGVTVNGKRMRF